MERTTHHMRMSMSCGYLPAESRTGESVWMPDDGTELTICAGYTTSLPDVLDCAVNVPNIENGVIHHVCPSGVPKLLITGANIIKATAERRASYRMREQAEKQKRGGR